MFHRIQQLPGYERFFGKPVVQGQHYAQSGDDPADTTRWLTYTAFEADNAVAAGITALVAGQDVQSRVIDEVWTTRLAGAPGGVVDSSEVPTDYLSTQAVTRLLTEEPFPGLLVFYQMGVDHTEHERGLVDGRTFLTDFTDGVAVKQLVSKLKQVEQFYNKVFLITSDHGHTEREPSPEGTEVHREEALDEPDEHNNNLHAKELDMLMQQMKEASRDPVTGVAYLPEMKVLRHPASEHAANATVVAALNGPVAHLYVRRVTVQPQQAVDLIKEKWIENGDPPWQGNIYTGAQIQEYHNWRDSPDPWLVDVIADGIIAGFSGLEWDFLNDHHDNSDGEFTNFHARIVANEPRLRRLAGVSHPVPPAQDQRPGCVDLLLVKKNGSYVVRTRPRESLSLASFFGQHGNLYPNAVERIQMFTQEADSRGAGSPDIVILFRDRMNEPATQRYMSGGNIRSWHGGLNPSDSYVPFIVSYPGGNVGAIEEHVVAACAPQCSGNWRLPDVVEEILKVQLPASGGS